MSQPAQLNNLQAPVTPAQELSFLEKIIDKKVNGVALSCFEAIVDWFLTTFSCCYPAYERLYQEKNVKITHFAGCYIEDRTARKIVTVTSDDPKDQVLLQTMTGIQHPHYITLDGRKVLFSGRAYGAVLFGAQYNTHHLVVTDVANHPGQVSIKEHETTGDIKNNIVDMNKPFKRNSVFGAIPLDAPDTVYVTEEGIREIRPENPYLEPA